MTQPSAFKRSVSPGDIILIIGVCVAALVALGYGFKYLLPSSSTGGDVKVLRCGYDDRGPVAEVQVTNSTDRMASYVITVAFSDPSQQVGTAIVTVTDLQPKQVAFKTAHATAASRSTLTCSVTDVSRR